MKNNFLPGGELPEDTSAKRRGAVDSLGITYSGPVLEGMVTGMDALLRSSTRANPLDPFDVEGGLGAVDEVD